MNKYQGSRWIGPVFFSWQYTGSPSDRVDVTWKGSIIVEEQLPLPPGRNPLNFSVQEPDEKRQKVSGALRFFSEPARLEVINLDYSDGRVEKQILFPNDLPPVPPKPGEVTSEESVLVERPPESDLFPYLYLSQWPDISEAELHDRFVQYDPGTAPPGSLYSKLLVAREQGRDAMLEQVDLFLGEKPPYRGRYLRDITELGAPMERLSALDVKFRKDPPDSLDAFKVRTEAALDMDWESIREYWQGKDYAEVSQRSWQNLFALCAQPGFNCQLADQLLRALALAVLIERIIASEPEGDGHLNEELPPVWPASRLEEGIAATVVLPGEIFPLPAADKNARDRLTGTCSPVPYAIGDLELVRQRLCRYQLGEVSGIENVLHGEYKESSEKSLRESRIEESLSESGAQVFSNELSGQRQDLLAETINTLKENFQYHYESQYGPPAKQLTVIVDGTVEPVDDKPQKNHHDRTTGSVRSLTQRAAGSLARKVHWQRSSASLDRDESQTLRRIDGRHTEGNIRAVYRWINKIYQCWTVTLGRRFVLEFIVREPAQGYIAGSFSLRGLSLREPPPLIDFGVKTFQDISIEPESPRYYAKLAAEYQVVDLQPPPAEESRSGLTFQSDDPVSRQSLPLEPGYRAVSATVSVSPAPGNDDLQLKIIVGQQCYGYPPAEGQSGNLELDGQTGQVPAAVLSSGEGIGAYNVAVEVTAKLSAQVLDRWKLDTYKAISFGCERLRERYYKTLSSWPGDRRQSSALGAGETVRGELRRDIVRQLLRQVETLTGESRDIVLGEQRYVQFFDRALSWEEMAYTFTVKTEDDLGTTISQQYRGEDELFSAFLQAGASRILLPVTPEFSYRMLYFLASGQIWPGADTLTPTFRPQTNGSPDNRYINLVNALKESIDVPQEEEAGETWELVVPTDMTVLQESDQLPIFCGGEP